MKLLCPLQHDTFVTLPIHRLLLRFKLTKEFNLYVSPLLTLREFANEHNLAQVYSSQEGCQLYQLLRNKLSHNFTEPYGYPDVPEFRIVKMHLLQK